MFSKKSNKTINLLLAIDYKIIEAKNNKGHFGFVLLPSLLIFAFLSLFVFTEYKSHSLKSQMNKINSYLTNDSVVLDIVKTQRLRDKSHFLASEIEEISNYNREIKSQKSITSEHYKKIESSRTTEMTIKTSSFSKDTNALLITAVSPSPNSVSNFVSNLKALNLFEDVVYDGYYESKNEYFFSVSCFLMEGEADE